MSVTLPSSRETTESSDRSRALGCATRNAESALSPSECGSIDSGQTTGRLAGLVSHEMVITTLLFCRLENECVLEFDTQLKSYTPNFCVI
jgi:hypothetical protein